MTITKRIDGITLIPSDRMKATLPAPKSVKIELSPRCNYRCGFCALRTRKVQPTRDMDFDLFKRITVDMVRHGVQEIGLFFLGESLCAPELVERAVHWLKSPNVRMPYVFLTTNGSLANAGVLYNLMAAGLDSLKFSINAADPEQFERVMGVKAALFHKALYNLESARLIRDNYKFPCRIYASSIRYDGEQQERMEALLQAYVLPFVDEHYWLPLYSMGAFATQREKELGYRPIAGNQGRLGALREPLPCWSAFTEGHVTADGLLSACCFDANSAWVMGDLKKQAFMEAWNSPAFVALREAHLKRDVKGTVCEQCIAYR